MTYIASQIIGLIVFVLVFASMQTKNMKAVLLCQIGINGLGMFSYVLLGGFSGCGIYLIATIQAIAFYFIRRSGKQEPRWLYPFIIVTYIGCSIATFKSWLDLIPMAGALCCGIGLVQKKPSNYRITMLLNGIIWLIYDLCIGAYTMLASHAITFVSALLGIIRLDIQKKASK